MSDALNPISSAEAARAFLEVGNGLWVSAMKMQKLVYMAHENHIAVTASPLISDPIEAWKFGPVFPALEKIIGNSEKESAGTEELRAIKVPHEEVIKYASVIWEPLKEWSGWDISKYTHSRGTPWHTARNPARSFIKKLLLRRPKHPVIEDAMIRQYCSQFVINADAERTGGA